MKMTLAQERKAAANHAAYLAWSKRWLAMRGSKIIHTRYDSVCQACGKPIARNEEAHWKTGVGVIHVNAKACVEA